MSKLQQAILVLQDLQSAKSCAGRIISPVCGLIVTFVYLIAMLSVEVDRVGMLLCFAIYPILAAPVLGMSFKSVFAKSLYLLPLIAFIGIFNPVFDTAPALAVGPYVISRGWLTFVSIILRGLLSVQALIILIRTCGFEGVCHGLRRMGLPAFLVTQLLMVYRYMTVLLNEALNMRRACLSRSYGRKRFPLKMWGRMTGQLFIRTVARSEAINRAMLARGFSGSMPSYGRNKVKWSVYDTVFMAAWTAAILLLRCFDLSKFFTL